MSTSAATTLSLSGPIRALVRVQTRSCQTATVHLSLSHRGTRHWRSTFTFEVRQKRCQSTARNARGTPPPPKPSATGAIFRMFGGSFRNLLSTFRGQRLKAVFRQNPEELVLALVMYAPISTTLGLSNSLTPLKSRRLRWHHRLCSPTVLHILLLAAVYTISGTCCKVSSPRSLL